MSRKKSSIHKLRAGDDTWYRMGCGPLSLSLPFSFPFSFVLSFFRRLFFTPFRRQNGETDINRRQFKFKCMLPFKYHKSLHEYTIMYMLLDIRKFYLAFYLLLLLFADENQWKNAREKREHL